MNDECRLQAETNYPYPNDRRQLLLHPNRRQPRSCKPAGAATSASGSMRKSAHHSDFDGGRRNRAAAAAAASSAARQLSGRAGRS